MVKTRHFTAILIKSGHPTSTKVSLACGASRQKYQKVVYELTNVSIKYTSLVPVVYVSMSCMSLVSRIDFDRALDRSDRYHLSRKRCA